VVAVVTVVTLGAAACSSTVPRRAPTSTTRPPPTTPAAAPGAGAPLPGGPAGPSCPAAVEYGGAVANVDPPGDHLVPASPSGGTLCRYYPVGGPEEATYAHGHLEGRAALDAATAQRLASVLDALRPAPSGPVSCPADFGTVDLIFFSYRGRPPLTVRASLTGCPNFSNGRYVAGGYPGLGSYTALVDALVPRHDQLPG
jgi:hypothetical protein